METGGFRPVTVTERLVCQSSAGAFQGVVDTDGLGSSPENVCCRMEGGSEIDGLGCFRFRSRGLEDEWISCKVRITKGRGYGRTRPAILVAIEAGLMSFNWLTADLTRRQSST